MRIAYILSCFVFIPAFMFSQSDTTVFRGVNNRPVVEELALTKWMSEKIEEDSFEVKRFTRKDGDIEENWKLKSSYSVKAENDSTWMIAKIKKSGELGCAYKRVTRKTDDGYYFKDYFCSGELSEEGTTATELFLTRMGEVKDYHKSGSVQIVSQYNKYQMVSNIWYNDDGSVYGKNIFSSVDKMADYPDGSYNGLNTYIAKNLEYPPMAIDSNISGTVYVRFIILKDGTMTGVTVIRSVHPMLDKAGKKMIESIDVKWIPAELDGKKVNTVFTIPIKYKLV